jgi:hypothetical protein
MKAMTIISAMKALRGPGRISPVKLFYLLLITLLLGSCYTEPWYGLDGRNGRAFLSLTWIDAKPEYLDAGTGDIPPVFEYGRYYRAWPGFYTMYYEGRYWNGQGYPFYAWEVSYEIWEKRGEPGGLYHSGADGPDNYFTIECSPYGPWIYGPGYKSGKLPEGYQLKESNDETIVIEKEDSHFGITVSYRKVPLKDTAEW